MYWVKNGDGYEVLDGQQRTSSICQYVPKPGFSCAIVYMVRNPVRFVPYKDRKAVIDGLKKLYPAPSADLALCALDEFAGVRDKKYPMNFQVVAGPVERSDSVFQVFI